MLTLPATQFKARCLAVLDRVARTGEEVTITKHGRPVARLVPPVRRGGSPLRHPLAGTVEVVGDILAPAVASSTWAVLREQGRSRRRRARARGGSRA